MGGLGLAFILIALVPLVAGIWTAVDASKFPDWAFESANSSKTLWIVLPVVGVLLCGLVALVAAIVWFTSVKPRVLAAAGRPGGAPPPPPHWN